MREIFRLPIVQLCLFFIFELLVEKLEERVTIINDFLTFSLFSNVCRSLFEKHKMLFAFLLCARILMDEKNINPHEWHFFLAGGTPAQVQNVLTF